MGKKEINLPKVEKNVYLKMFLSHTGTVSLFLLYMRTMGKRMHKKYLLRVWRLRYRGDVLPLKESIEKKLAEKPMTVRQLSDSIRYGWCNINMALRLMRRMGEVDRRPPTSAESTHIYPNTRWIWYSCSGSRPQSLYMQQLPKK